MYARFHARNAVHKQFSQVGLKFQRADPLTRDDQLRRNFATSPQNKKIPNSLIIRYTCQFEQYLSHR